MLNRFARTRVLVVSLAALGVGVALLLTACESSIGKDGVAVRSESSAERAAKLSEKVTEIGSQLTAAGQSTGVPWFSLAGYALTGLGAIGTSLWGASKKLEAHDAAPFIGPNGEQVSEAQLVASALPKTSAAPQVGKTGPLPSS
jgi:hypothetical protein